MPNTHRSWLIVIGAASLLLPRCQGIEPTLGAQVRNIEIKATVVPARALTISAPADGKVERIQIKEGMSVGSGQILAALSNPTLDHDYAIARARRALAESNLRNSGFVVPVANRVELRGVENALGLVLENKKAKLDRYRELRKRRDISEQELEDAENEYAWAERDYLTGRSNGVVAPQINRRALEMELAAARAEERLAREREEALKISSPIAGTVTAVRAIEGQQVYARDPLVEVTDVSTVEVRGDISPDLNRYVQPGTPVEVKVFAVPAQTFHAVVDHVVDSATSAAGSVVVVRLRNDKTVIRPNTPARIIVQF